MKILYSTGKEDIAVVYVAEMGEGKMAEFVESIQPPLPREKKWVLIVSTLYGCPVNCIMCDAGGSYKGKLSEDEIFSQINFLIKKRFPDGKIPVEKFKIQFSRVGDPAMNISALCVLEKLPYYYNTKSLIPCISSVAPLSCNGFFEKLLIIKNKFYREGRFQLQFSIQTSDENLRDAIIPVQKWNFSQIAEYGEKFHTEGDRKISLNFALIKGVPLDGGILISYFDPQKFLIKLTPLNPTYKAMLNNLCSYIDIYDENKDYDLVNNLRKYGYEVIVSIGEKEENKIGSNCGQYIQTHLKSSHRIKDGYTYIPL